MKPSANVLFDPAGQTDYTYFSYYVNLLGLTGTMEGLSENGTIFAPFLLYKMPLGSDTYTTGVSLLVQLVDPSTIAVSESEIPIVTSWKTPFIQAFAGRVQQVMSVRPFYKYKRTGATEAKIFLIANIFDYSDYILDIPWPWYIQVTGSAVGLIPDNSASTSVSEPVKTGANYSPMLGLTGLGGGVSFQISQTNLNFSDVDAEFEIYALTAYIKDGGIYI
jgi:hypothetical protein